MSSRSTLLPHAGMRASARRQRRLAALAPLALLVAAGCDRAKAALNPPPVVESRWTGDSTLLANDPQLLFQVHRTERGAWIVPFATIGEGGLRGISLGNRGMRALDLKYFAKGAQLRTVRAGRTSGEVTTTRGYWDPVPADSLCHSRHSGLLPFAMANVPGDVHFVTSRPLPPLKPVTPLRDGELQQVLATIPTLVAPPLGVSGSMLSRYRRNVHVVATGITNSPSIVLEYDDPEPVSDTTPLTARPRQLVLVLDRGIYGYRPSYKYTTVGTTQAPVRLRFRDFVDTDGDGKAELFFGTRDSTLPVAALVLRFESEAWREALRFVGTQCAL